MEELIVPSPQNITEELFPCTESGCEKTFKHKGDLSKHMLSCSSIKTTNSKNSNSEISSEIPEVEFSDSTFNTRKNGKTSKNLREKPFKCTDCDKSFVFQGTLNTHVWNFHRIEMSEDENSDTIFTDARLRSSSATSHERPFQCRKCKKSFKFHGTLINHMWNSHSIKIERIIQSEFECLICHKIYNDRQMFRYHSIIHSGKRPWSCEVCKKTFQRNTSLNIHKRIHQIRKNLKCDTYKAQLMNHL